MFKDIARSIDLGALPQIGLVAFVVAFLAIAAYAFWMPRADRRTYAALPLDDDTPAGDGAPSTGDTPAAAAPPDAPAADPSRLARRPASR